MKSFIEQARFYHQYHRMRATLLSHLIGVPLIIFSIMILFGVFRLSSPGLFDVSFAKIGTLILILYYLRLNWRLGLLLIPVLLILLWLSSFISHHGISTFSVWMFILFFVVGWAFQLIGHYMEGSSPAFLTSAQQALVAPVFLMAEVCFHYGWFKSMQQQIHAEDVPM